MTDLRSIHLFSAFLISLKDQYKPISLKASVQYVKATKVKMQNQFWLDQCSNVV